MAPNNQVFIGAIIRVILLCIGIYIFFEIITRIFSKEGGGEN